MLKGPRENTGVTSQIFVAILVKASSFHLPHRVSDTHHVLQLVDSISRDGPNIICNTLQKS